MEIGSKTGCKTAHGKTAKQLERAKGIEPSYAAWEAAVLPLNYARKRAFSHFWLFVLAPAQSTSDGPLRGVSLHRRSLRQARNHKLATIPVRRKHLTEPKTGATRMQHVRF